LEGIICEETSLIALFRPMKNILLSLATYFPFSENKYSVTFYGRMLGPPLFQK
jgi:hypothetical protein